MSKTYRAAPPVLLDELPFQLKEAYKSLRTSLLYSSPDKPIKSLLVTSCGKSDGKSTIAINLALVLAQAGYSVLLVDADLRAPSVNRYLALPKNPGLVNMLAKSDDSRPDRFKNTYSFSGGTIDVLTCGTIPLNPSELLGSQKMQAFTREARELYDYVIYDTPPVLPVTDAVVLSKFVDGVIIVYSADVTTKKEPAMINAAFRSVGANVLGCILNNAEIDKHDYKYTQKYY